MRDKPFHPGRLDVEAFARAQGSLQGELPRASLPRLVQSVLPEAAAAPVVWQVSGSCRTSPGRDPLIRLDLVVRTQVQLTCQRCLEPLELPLDLQRRLRFEAGEEAAERLDESLEDEDVLALTPRLDLTALIEDELILSLPIVPRHDVCPPQAQTRLGAWQEAEPEPAVPRNPFEALAALRKGTGAD
ncbi:MAG: DUF177 domain-containing protein [Rubrivivax sp.]|nr:DUF177 domain-containing protein [Rubrivivax sp.]